MKKILLLILGITVALQLLIPVSMILKHEKVMRDGSLYRFKTRPIDPVDPFQGRYVQLGFENDYIVAPTNAIEPARNERVYVTLGTDPAGLCKMTGWSRSKPEQGNYLKLKYWGKKYNWSAKDDNQRYSGLQFKLPFDRFYMEESKAPRAERLVRNRRINRSDENTNLFINCWANVRVLNGAGLIEDVLVDGTPIGELAAKPDKQRFRKTTSLLNTPSVQTDHGEIL